MNLISIGIILLLPVLQKCAELPDNILREIERSYENINEEQNDVLANHNPRRPSFEARCPFRHEAPRREVPVMEEVKKNSSSSSKKHKKHKSKSKKHKKDKKKKHSKRNSSSSSSSTSSSSSSSSSCCCSTDKESIKRVRKAMQSELNDSAINHPSTSNADITKCPHFRRFLAEQGHK